MSETDDDGSRGRSRERERERESAKEKVSHFQRSPSKNAFGTKKTKREGKLPVVSSSRSCSSSSCCCSDGKPHLAHAVGKLSKGGGGGSGIRPCGAYCITCFSTTPLSKLKGERKAADTIG